MLYGRTRKGVPFESCGSLPLPRSHGQRPVRGHQGVRRKPPRPSGGCHATKGKNPLPGGGCGRSACAAAVAAAPDLERTDEAGEFAGEIGEVIACFDRLLGTGRGSLNDGSDLAHVCRNRLSGIRSFTNPENVTKTGYRQLSFAVTKPRPFLSCELSRDY